MKLGSTDIAAWVKAHWGPDEGRNLSGRQHVAAQFIQDMAREIGIPSTDDAAPVLQVLPSIDEPFGDWLTASASRRGAISHLRRKWAWLEVKHAPKEGPKRGSLYAAKCLLNAREANESGPLSTAEKLAAAQKALKAIEDRAPKTTAPPKPPRRRMPHCG